jgi:hypothetical protein
MATTGMIFTLDPNGNPIAQYFPDTGADPTTGLSVEGNAETPYPGEWQVVVTGVPGGTAPATIAAMFTSKPLALPLPWGAKRWKIAYATLNAGACTASVYS